MPLVLGTRIQKFDSSHPDKINDNIIPYKCQLYGLSSHWNERPISLQIDHINRVRNDHRIENLRFLCPSCHSQTETYAGRNIEYPESTTKHTDK